MDQNYANDTRGLYFRKFVYNFKRYSNDRVIEWLAISGYLNLQGTRVNAELSITSNLTGFCVYLGTNFLNSCKKWFTRLIRRLH